MIMLSHIRLWHSGCAGHSKCPNPCSNRGRRANEIQLGKYFGEIMGEVVNKSFDRIQKNIANKADKLLTLLQEHNGTLYGKWTKKKNKVYEKLSISCDAILGDIDSLNEIEVPEFEKDR
jgi:hypothetical protein